jgi:hypothetical protein
MLDGELPVHSMNLIDFILKSEPEGDLLIESLLCLLVILQQHILIVLEVGVLLPQ